MAQAARTVFASRQAIVIGPTPPGTGVIAPATFAASAKATSPTRRVLPPSPGDAVDADIDHGRARLDPVAAHHLRPADRGEQQIGAAADRRQIARSCECAIVTVAFSASSSCASGLPTMLERPITTASRPASEACTVFARMTQPSGVQGTSAGRPVASRPALTGWKPSTSLRRIDGGEHRAARRSASAAAVAPGCRAPPDRRLSRSHQRQQLGLARRLPAGGGRTSACRPRPSPCALLPT